MATVGTLQRISAAKLRDLLVASKTVDPTVAVIDVRDDDFIGGHIKGAHHFPSQKLDATLATLVRLLKDKQTVIFHCALSQQRGPGAALRYMRERDRILAREEKQRAATDANKDKTGQSTNESVEAASVPIQQQKVYVLDRGFVGWQETYGQDETLTEGYRKELWKDGYWG